ncbi:MAG: alpha/beta hydrolase [Acidimicrobiia bacterium]
MTEAGTTSESRIQVGGSEVEYRIYQPGSANPLVFLHDGLGSMGSWKDFPRDLAVATGKTAVVYSREGHGWSDPLRQPRTPDFMHREALALDQFLHELELSDVVFVGHSDGATISLILTGQHRWASGLILIAPHVFVEPETIAGIEQAVRRFETTDLPQRLARYHRDPEEIFKAWSEIWLDPAFRDWNIEDSLPNIQCPVLLVQAVDDEYGTMAQLDAIERGVIGPVERLTLSQGGHSPHVSHPDQVSEAVIRFVSRLGPDAGGIGR